MRNRYHEAMPEGSWMNYMTAAMGDDTPADVARTLNVSRSSVSRWIGGQIPGPQEVIRFARAYGRSPVQALTAAGYLKPHEATRTEWDISMVADDDFLEETRRRFNR
ncbi:helix-turn-helix domain-containing protein [Corynebacterium variabile]|uniref:helix-turn-helix domain-containing protein n=1 Tax=Corynebacterium variabile TaxID=1727 RepID=UPI0026471BC2|nr:helix-turn-helix transcriptional regulator [Corynebacterium variabile]MDN6676158.1 helix-turn-helix transcriptional regulator [Corynebacterium variabile]